MKLHMLIMKFITTFIYRAYLMTYITQEFSLNLILDVMSLSSIFTSFSSMFTSVSSFTILGRMYGISTPLEGKQLPLMMSI